MRRSEDGRYAGCYGRRPRGRCTPDNVTFRVRDWSIVLDSVLLYVVYENYK